jgi:DNA-binding Xre family transcriptional regulator
MPNVLDRYASFSSRSLLSIAEEMGQLGVWSHSLRTGESFWSPGIHRMIGTSPAVDKPSFETLLRNVHPDDSKSIREAWELLRQGFVPELTFRVIHPNGSLRWLTRRCEVLYTKDGTPHQIVGLLMDTTSQESLRELFRKNEQRLGALAEGFKFSVWSADRSGALTSLPQWRSLGLESYSQVMGWDWLKIVPKSERAQTKTEWEKAVASGKRFTSHIKLALSTTKDPIKVTVYSEPVSASDGTILEWVGLIVLPAKPSDYATYIQKIKPAHIRASRALLEWSIEDLSRASGVSVSSIRRVEGGEASSVRGQTLEFIKTALEKGGVTFHFKESNISIGLRA